MLLDTMNILFVATKVNSSFIKHFLNSDSILKKFDLTTNDLKYLPPEVKAHLRIFYVYRIVNKNIILPKKVYGHKAK